ncbi:MAG: L,D-transpeptidase family protein [Phycisphaerales bacterium JB039]
MRSKPSEAKAGAEDATLAINGEQFEAKPPAPAPYELTQRRGAAALQTETEDRAEEDVLPPKPVPEPALATPTTARPAAARTTGAEVQALVQVAEEKLQGNDPVAARRLFNDALRHPQATEADRRSIRSQMSAINEDLVFSPRLLPGDPLVERYVIQSGDRLSDLATELGLATDYRFIARVNRLSSADRISVGQTMKLVRGPFHAIVDKSEFRMDLYAGPGENPGDWIYITSRPVGLGESGATPTGVFVVRRESKLINPVWTNPRTGEMYDADDPDNPIGERWIGLRGLADAAAFAGYGIHGTIEPESIGQERSMGCVRMLAEDVELVYEMLAEDVSYVHIVP